MRPTFAELRNSIQQHLDSVNELKAMAYGIQEITCLEKKYVFICYYDMETTEMGVTILDQHMSEIRMTSEIPKEVYVLFGAYSHAVTEWQEGRGEFPAGNLDAQYTEFVTLSKHLLDDIKIQHASSEELELEETFMLDMEAR